MQSAAVTRTLIGGLHTTYPERQTMGYFSRMSFIVRTSHRREKETAQRQMDPRTNSLALSHDIQSRACSQTVDRGSTNGCKPNSQCAASHHIDPDIHVLVSWCWFCSGCSSEQWRLATHSLNYASTGQPGCQTLGGQSQGRGRKSWREMWSREGSLVARVCGLSSLRQQKFCKDQCQLDCLEPGFL